MIVESFLFSLLVTAVSAGSAADLVGTWTTKSRNVVTGPAFYDPIGDQFFEPNLTGISYSFTADGHYEEAYYRAIADPTNPSCPQGIMQWQHGTYSVNSTGSVTLTPIAVDGRQLLSDPCSTSVGIYTRYNKTETFKSFTVGTDPYHNVQRLDIDSFDGSPMIPMYLIYQPPQMLPTTTLNPVSTPTAKSKRHVARDTESSSRLKNLKSMITRDDIINSERWLWLGVFMTALGGVALLYS